MWWHMRRNQISSCCVWNVMAHAQKPDFVLLRLKCDGTRAETRFRLSAKRTSPFQSAGPSVQSTTGSWGMRTSGNNAGYTTFRGSVKSTGHTHTPFASFPFTSPPVRHRVPSRFNWTLPYFSTLPYKWHDFDIFINCNWVVTRWQYTFTHKQYIEQHNNWTTQITTNVEECGTCPVFAGFTLAFALQLRKKLLNMKCVLIFSTTFVWNISQHRIMERFQSKVLRIITNAPWYVPNTMLRSDLQFLSVKPEVRNYSINHRHRLDNHPNRLARTRLLGTTHNRRLKQCHPVDLTYLLHGAESFLRS